MKNSNKFPRELKSNFKKLIFILLLPLTVCSQGSLTNVTFYSPSLNVDRNIQIYLPEGYNPQDSKKYPVVYFLHGTWVDHSWWGTRFKEGLDLLISNATISPLILVKPDGSIGPWAGSFYTHSELYGNFEAYIVSDLVSFIDTNYNSIPERAARAIWGYSMGGFGAMKLALKHPNMYCAVAAHSGPLDFSHWVSWIDSILYENGGTPVSEYVPTPEKPATYIFYSMSGAFSPNLNNPPYFVDFPLDSMGNIVDSTYNKWLLHDPARLVLDHNPGDRLAIYFDCGEQDNLLFYPFNIGFKDSLDRLDLEYTFRSYEGRHENNLPERLPVGIMFIDSVIKELTTTISAANRFPVSSHILHQNYPNPFNPSTKIKFSLPKPETVTIEIYNIIGQKIATPLNKPMPAGYHEVEFNGQNLSSGIYLYRIEAGAWQDVKKMVLLQ